MTKMSRYWDEIIESYRPMVGLLLELIDDEWAILDDDDRDEHLVLVNEGRETHPLVRPTRELVERIVERGFVEYEDWSQRPGDTREYISTPAGYVGQPKDPTPVPLVFSFRVTSAGREFVNDVGLSEVCAELLSRAEPAKALAYADLGDALAEHGLPPSQSRRLLELHARFGCRRIRDLSRETQIWLTLGAQRVERTNDANDVIVEFFDFGVAAPYGVFVTPDGAVLASDGIARINVARSFECFVEGIAHEQHASEKFDSAVGATMQLGWAELLELLPTDPVVAAASDDHSVWWLTDSWAARLRKTWETEPPPRSIDLTVWNAASAPEQFKNLLDG